MQNKVSDKAVKHRICRFMTDSGQIGRMYPYATDFAEFLRIFVQWRLQMQLNLSFQIRHTRLSKNTLRSL